MMEITVNVPGLERLADAIMAMAGRQGGGMDITAQPAVQVTPTVPTAPVTAPVVQQQILAAPETVSVNQPQEEESLPSLTEVRAVLAEKKKAGKDIKGLLQAFGVGKLPEVKQEDYPALLLKAGEL